jgi:nicotinamide-nucleotide amidase
MARGARRSAQADLALAVSGIAGPGGGTTAKPVGLVYVALSSGTGEQVIKLQLRGQRERIKELSAKYALYLLYCHLAGKQVNSNLVVTV